MATLRDIIDGRTIEAASDKASPLAKHVASHMADPIGATKPGFQKLQKAKLQYDMAREEMQRNLAPVQTTLTHLSQMHGLVTNMPTPPMDNAQGQNPDLEEAQQYDEFGNPINTQQVPGQQNQNNPALAGKQPGAAPKVGDPQRPSLVGHQPGVAPGFSEKQVTTPKLGMASPGGPTNARNSPAPNSQGLQYNRQAAPPKGNRSLPGAKGPGDAKVENRSKQAQKSSVGLRNQQSRPVKVTVHATQNNLNTVDVQASRGLATLKSAMSISHGGPPMRTGGPIMAPGRFSAPTSSRSAMPSGGGGHQEWFFLKEKKWTPLRSCPIKQPLARKARWISIQ